MQKQIVKKKQESRKLRLTNEKGKNKGKKKTLLTLKTEKNRKE